MKKTLYGPTSQLCVDEQQRSSQQKEACINWPNSLGRVAAKILKIPLVTTRYAGQKAIIDEVKGALMAKVLF